MGKGKESEEEEEKRRDEKILLDVSTSACFGYPKAKSRLRTVVFIVFVFTIANN